MNKDLSHVADTALRAPTPTSADPDTGNLLPGSLHDALRALAAELSELGWTSHARTLPGRVPSLRASNPEPGAAALSEDIHARSGPDGGWEYWWPWGERIAADPAGAAAVIVRVLRPAGTP